MTETLTIALAQLSQRVGDLAANADAMLTARKAATGADLVLFPELQLIGYPPEDLVLKPAFQEACRTAVEALARETADGGPAVLVGLPYREEDKLYNSYALLDGGRIDHIAGLVSAGRLIAGGLAHQSFHQGLRLAVLVDSACALCSASLRSAEARFSADIWASASLSLPSAKFFLEWRPR